MVYCGCYGLLKSEKTMMFRKLRQWLSQILTVYYHIQIDTAMLRCFRTWLGMARGPLAKRGSESASGRNRRPGVMMFLVGGLYKGGLFFWGNLFFFLS